MRRLAGPRPRQPLRLHRSDARLMMAAGDYANRRVCITVMGDQPATGRLWRSFPRIGPPLSTGQTARDKMIERWLLAQPGLLAAAPELAGSTLCVKRRIRRPQLSQTRPALAEAGR